MEEEEEEEEVFVSSSGGGRVYPLSMGCGLQSMGLSYDGRGDEFSSYDIRLDECESVQAMCMPDSFGDSGAAPSPFGTASNEASKSSLSSITCNNVPVLSVVNNLEGKLPVVSGMMNKMKLDNDLTMVPKQLDTQFEKFGNDEKYGGALRSTVIKTGECWTKKSKPNILSKPESTFLKLKEHKEEKDKALDLLDALSRSGSLPIKCAELHVVIASTHYFGKSVINTVVQDNINPIEKLERSSLLVASVIHGVDVGELIRDKTQLSRITETSPYLLANEDML